MNLERIHRWIVAPATLALVFAIAPLEGSDEHTHLYRIDALSNGSVVPVVQRLSPAELAAGGEVDVALRDWITRLAPSYDKEIVPRRPATVAATFDRRADGETAWAPHSNTAIYPPLLYLQSTAALTVARAVDAPVAAWSYAARFANALVAILIVAVAMRRLPAFRPLLLVVAALPVTMFLSATASADAILVPVALVFACLLARIFDTGPLGVRASAVLVAATVVLGVGKVAYLPLALLPPLAARAADGRWSNRARVLALASIATVVAWAAWAWIVHDKVFSIRPDHPVDPGGQLHWMLTHPVDAAAVVGRSLAAKAPFLASTAMGSHLGNLNLRLWHPLIYLALVAFAATATVDVIRARPPRWYVATVFGIACAIGGVVVLLLYLQFNPVGNAYVEGMQGRYFLPPLIACVAFWPVKAGPRGRMLVERLVGWFAIASASTTLWAVTRAYWIA